MCSVGLYYGNELLSYSFPRDHHFNKKRVESFWKSIKIQGLLDRSEIVVLPPVLATEEILEYFHTKEYIQYVKERSELGQGSLDYGDTPAFKGVFEAACFVVGSVIDGLERVMSEKIVHCFIPVAGLHHSRRSKAAGFCVFNDIGVAISYIQKRYQLGRILYVDIDAHHGDGVHYEFYDDPQVFIADIHEELIYPGTGAKEETGSDNATGTKLNLPLSAGSGDTKFRNAFSIIEKFARHSEPQLIIFQAGADGLKGDPITHLQYTSEAHLYATEQLHQIAHEYCEGKMIALGGGGYNSNNTAAAWSSVLESLIGIS